PFNKGGGKGIPPIPVLGIPACGMYHKTTIFDLILPRALAGETIGRKELAELGHGGLCLNCKKCAYSRLFCVSFREVRVMHFLSLYSQDILPIP
ncbi:MAG: hypothetical protein L6245_02845, partial [Thermodesulfovibrionales bacterium]|nr:hypothetical protein [Thermodesulfovibrionales bacterium]